MTPNTWSPTLGAVVGPHETSFRVWAPRPVGVELVRYTSAGERFHALQQEGEYWSGAISGVHAGDRYRFRLEGLGDFPDPCSRSQPEGVHGPSEVVAPGDFAWSDSGWSPPLVADLAIYECHVGTFTRAGTFDGAIQDLPRLRALGVNVLELMPVASFPGRRNWGYDGAAMWAPAAVYGGPSGLRRLVDAAHSSGIAVCLDVVLNHFGPTGNYTGLYSGQYLTNRYQTPWGDAVNFDGLGSEEVRRFYIEQLLHWVHEYHIDGFRFDATHSIFDRSPRHILSEVSEALQAQPRGPTPPLLFAESHENDVRYLRPRAKAGFQFDAVWADDFHHVVRSMLHHERDGYFAAFEGTADELARVVKHGFLYEGQHDAWMGEPRGTRARSRPPYQFVYCLQNHDQVGNRAFGQRLNITAAQADFLAATLLLLLTPCTPLLFQGQEFLASSPFQLFTDHEEELGRAVTAGRRREFGRFAAFADPATRELIPDPQADGTFERSKLDRREGEGGVGRLASSFFSALLALRSSDSVLVASRRKRPRMSTTVAGSALLVDLRNNEGRRVIALNLGEPVELRLAGARGLEVVIHSGEPRFSGNAQAPRLSRGKVWLPGHHAAFLRPAGERQPPPST